jgi:hypothetical protein
LDGVSRSKGGDQVPVAGAPRLILIQQLGDRNRHGDAHLPIGILLSPGAVVLLTQQHDLKPVVLDPAQMAHQARQGHQRGAGQRRAAGVGLGQVLTLGVDGGADIVQEGGEDRALVPASWDVGPRHRQNPPKTGDCLEGEKRTEDANSLREPELVDHIEPRLVAPAATPDSAGQSVSTVS